METQLAPETLDFINGYKAAKLVTQQLFSLELEATCVSIRLPWTKPILRRQNRFRLWNDT